jgi:hypothetical protein
MVVLGVLGALAAGSLSSGAEEGGAGADGVAVVYLADGTSTPLLDWRFSYEYKAIPRGASRGLVKSSFSESRELWLDKHALEVAGRTLELEYKAVEIEHTEGTETVKSLVSQVGKLVVVGPGDRRRELEPRAPRANRLRTESEKKDRIVPIMLDLKGRSLAGTERRFCLAAFQALITCRPRAGDRVMRVVFPE